MTTRIMVDIKKDTARGKYEKAIFLNHKLIYNHILAMVEVKDTTRGMVKDIKKDTIAMTVRGKYKMNVSLKS